MRITRIVAMAPFVMTALAMAPQSQGFAFHDDRGGPNVVIIFCDDLGYGDLGIHGAQGYETPNLDQMRAEGLTLTDFYVAQPVCTASRAALLTGCYPNRVGLTGALGPQSRNGIAEEELTLGELFQSQGYKSAIFGKWHLGCQESFLPLKHGFDEFYGIPYSNDMWPHHPESPNAWGDLPTIEGEKVIGLNTDQSTFTGDFTERTVKFIEERVLSNEKFFVYLAHPMVHVPLHASKEYQGRSERGLFGDVMREIDDSLGRVRSTLKSLNVEEDTLLIFTSDNGPWLSYGDHAGTTGGLREGKGTTFEGGVRVPCLVAWPGTLEAGGVRRQPMMTIDMLPTLAALIGAPLPEAKIDGRDLWHSLLENESTEAHPYFFYYHNNDLEAMRLGRWKLHFSHKYRTLDGRLGGRGGQPSQYNYAATIESSLFDLWRDPGETCDISADHIDVLKQMNALASAMRQDLGDDLEGIEGQGRRAPGKVE